MGGMELPEGFGERVIALADTAPNTGSDVRAYVDDNDVPQLRGYLAGLSEEWLGGYLSLHPDADEDALRQVVEEAQQLSGELETAIDQAQTTPEVGETM